MSVYFGSEVKRVEDKRLVAGRGRYVDDLKMHGMLEAAFVRSPSAHAAIKSIDVSMAQAMPGVHAVLTMRDFEAFSHKRMIQPYPHPAITQSRTQYPLALDEVCYVGEPIAVVIADSRYIAEDAAALVDVDLEPLPVAASYEISSEAGSPTAHKDAADNIAARLKAGFGDVETVFSSAPHVFSEVIYQHRGGCHSMEGRGVVASADNNTGQITIWSSTQSPYMVKRFVAGFLDWDERSIRVIAPDVGGGFGPKAAVYPEEIVLPLASLRLGRPIKWIEDRREHFYSTAQQRDQRWTMEVAAASDGTVLGIKAHVCHDNGAYLPYGLLLPLTCITPFPGPYALKCCSVSVDVVYTNTTPNTPVRGAGRPNAAFAIERMIELVARNLKLNPADVRRKNYVPKENFPYATGMKARDGTPIVYDSGDFQQCLDSVVELADVSGFETRRAEAAKKGRLRGYGISSCVEDTGLPPFEGATVRISGDGKAEVLTGAASQGQGHETVFSQICADMLGLNIRDVRVRAADTDLFPLGIGTIASRVAATAGPSVHLAATQVREKILKFAGEQLEVAPSDLTIEEGVVKVQGVPNLQITVAEIAKKLSGAPGVVTASGFTPGLEATAYHTPDQATYASGSNIAEVEVDPETGWVEVKRYSVAHDCGRLINPQIVDGQIRGGVIHGIGNALFEHMEYDENGQPLTTNYGEYLLPIATEMPNVDIVHVESPSPRNPLGVKGAGEGGTIPAPAAVIAALEHALEDYGIRITEYPVTPMKLLELIQQSGRLASDGAPT